MSIAVIPVLIAWFLLTRTHLSKPRAADCGIAAAATFFVVSSAIEKTFLGAPTHDHVLAVSELFDMAGIYERTGTHCVPAALVPASTPAEAIMAEYDPTLVNTIIWSDGKGGFILPDSGKSDAKLRSRWMWTIRNHPAAYLAVKARFARLFLMIGVDRPMELHPNYPKKQLIRLAPGGVHAPDSRPGARFESGQSSAAVGVAVGLFPSRGNPASNPSDLAKDRPPRFRRSFQPRERASAAAERGSPHRDRTP
jgi:hypothetical protein